MHRALVGIACALLPASGVTAARAEPGRGDDEGRDGTGPDREIADMVGRVEADRIEENIERLQAFGTRQACSNGASRERGVNAARDFLFERFSAVRGLEVRLDPFTHPRCPKMPTFNVIAWLPGTRHPERLVIIGGHYDSRTIDVNDAVSDAPGANDSGSQAALVLEAAKVLARQRYDATLVFVTFSGEEQGLIGSGSLAARLDNYFAQPEVLAMLNSDIVGGDDTVNTPADLQKFRLYSPGTPRETTSAAADGTTDNTSPSRGLMRYVGTWGSAYVPTMQMVAKLREDRPGRASDHRSFINLGVPGVRFMETFECSPSPIDNGCGGPLPCPPPATVRERNAKCLDFNTSHQHSPFDLFKFVTPDYVARVVQVVVATAASLARAPGAPREIAVAGNAAQGATVSWSAPAAGTVDHYVIAARSTDENFYRQRVSTTATTRSVSPTELGMTPSQSFFISVAAVDAQGHESLFAYPELRCDAAACVIPRGALDVTIRK
jgi:hypothetical protein